MQDHYNHSYTCMQDHYEQHYAKVSSSYDCMFSDYSAANVSIINRHLRFTADDSILDIGGGTAEISHQLWKTHNLKTPVLCVDPSEAMLAIARSKEGVETVKSTAEQFFKNNSDGRLFSKILFLGCYHHLSDPGIVFAGVARVLSDNGVCLVLRVTSDSPPVCFANTHSGYIDFQQIAKLAESKGLRAKVLDDYEACRPIKKEACFQFLRKRMVSSMSEFTDAEIEMRIKELDQRHSGSQMIDMEYKFNLVVITKCADREIT